MAKKVNPMLAIVGGLFAVLLLFSIIAVVLYPGPAISSDHGVQEGDTVSVHYVGKRVDGTVFDSNQGEDGREPLTFVVGSHQVIKGFENGVIGMESHETKIVTISPEDAYPYNPDMVVTYNKTDVIESLGSTPEVGDKLMLVTGTGAVVEGIVTEITQTTIVIDFNSELAGETLVFEITIVDIVKGEGGSH
ncbi:FKBP-type peptidyl-prolyl cis-trans isomerase [Methanimicrococcus blatticola]|uniref:Peptidyl-prolyl cis-trans isomerase n=1 Tax=Methanimicrococcus blatticola TaxID=91560 RepID=A0A484F754_9EURY|nr:FKBP-type peptidyl-prolyl cis-trans isomerase [Methanimicrococcus blatticola]MBZ3934883.1 FKBP-type peptidyl-prolyl cis-trans isomerase [Methanimicrococcus blatticola]MCC2509018.1 FKBP-type peptidyl-prolyl cis-trans isomerase [Methanimicrococcus blatticola]TDQ70955.1 FKBP-type peptidyl-prolyl cis-trans isomerase 2 [Methanimicrococcus blatticola]